MSLLQWYGDDDDNDDDDGGGSGGGAGAKFLRMKLGANTTIQLRKNRYSTILYLSQSATLHVSSAASLSPLPARINVNKSR